MVKIITGTLYSCDCGYETLSSDRASKHSKTIKCVQNTMVKREMRFVSEEDYMANTGHAVNNTIYSGDHSNNSINITINLSVPEKSVVSAVYDAVKKPQCATEIKYADPQEIPAILFKYIRGTCADKQYIKLSLIHI